MSDAVVRIAVVASAVAAFGAAPRVTQDRQQPVFKGSTVVVAVDAVVRDSGGNPIRDLTREDFQILEDGEARDLQTCTLIDLPVTRGAPGALVIVRPVATNASDGRVYVIAIDAFHMTPAGAHRITPILEQFITDYVEPTDLVSVVRLDYSARGSEFTSDKARLLSLVGAANVPGGSNAPPQMAAPLGNGPLGPTAQITERMLGTLASAMQYAARPQGRRTTVLLVSEGIDTDIFSAGAGNDEALRTLDAQGDAIEAAARANVNIYAIDPRGMSAIDAGVATHSPDGAGDGGRPRGLRQWDSLRTLAGETGGRAIVGALDLRQSFAQLVQEDSTYYILGYGSPHADDHDGKFHEVTVRVRRPGATVEARKRWYAAKRKEGKTAAALSAAWSDNSLVGLLARPLPTGNLGLTLRATAAPVRVSRKESTVAVVLEGSSEQLPWQNSGQGAQARVEVAYRGIAENGKEISGGPQAVAFRRAASSSPPAAGWRYVGELTLPAGHWQLRLAARVLDSERAGSVFLDVDVPDPARLPVALGDILLTSRLGAMPTSGRAPDLEPVLPGPPTTARVFSRDDTLVAFAQVAGKQADSATVRGVIRADSGEGPGRPVPLEPHVTNAGTKNYIGMLPLASLVPGAYVLSLDARAPKGDAISRSVFFTVR